MGSGIQREADVEPQRADRGVVAQAGAGAELDALARVGIDAVEDAAGVEEDHGAQVFGDAVAQLGAGLEEEAAAQALVVAVERARQLVGDAADRAAAAGVEALVGRDVVAAGAQDAADGAAQRQHEVGLGDEADVARGGGAELQELAARPERVEIGGGEQVEAAALGRVQEVVREVPVERARQQDEAEELLRLVAAARLEIDVTVGERQAADQLLGERVLDAGRGAGRDALVGGRVLALQLDVVNLALVDREEVGLAVGGVQVLE